jgi:hypothetical protein
VAGDLMVGRGVAVLVALAVSIPLLSGAQTVHEHSLHGANDARLAELLARNPDLALLRLSSARLTAKGYRALGSATRLRQLRLQHCGISDTDLPFLARLRAIELLDLSFNDAITDAGLEAFREPAGGSSSLEVLILSGNHRLDGSGLGGLAGLPRLADLSLAGTALDDRGLERAAALPGLRHLDATGTRVSGAGIKSLKRLRPGLVVSSHLPSRETAETESAVQQGIAAVVLLLFYFWPCFLPLFLLLGFMILCFCVLGFAGARRRPPRGRSGDR